MKRPAPAPSGETEALVDVLTGGNPRSLGRAEEVVRRVLHAPARLGELFGCVFSPDDIVRMRAADALEKVCRQHPEWFAPYVDTLLDRASRVDQPSVQWHVAQMLGEVELSAKQRPRAAAIVRRNLEHSQDWIVLNCSLETMAQLARDDPALREGSVALLTRHAAGSRKSVAKRANRLLTELSPSLPRDDLRR